MLVLGATAAFAAPGCSGGGGAGEDKAGGSGEPVVLRLANTNGQIDFTPAVEYFVEPGRGAVRRRPPHRGRGRLGAALLRRRAAGRPRRLRGEVDLGWVGTRVFDRLGVKSFQALTAPMLIDSYALQNAVIEGGITEEMMQGLDDLGVAGLGVLPDGLRKPIGVDGPILGPADWQGQSPSAP